MKHLKNSAYDQIFKALMEKNWDYGENPNKPGTRLGPHTLRQRLDSGLMREVLKCYFDKNKFEKYKWILTELDKFIFYVCDKINSDGTIDYKGVFTSRCSIYCLQFM